VTVPIAVEGVTVAVKVNDCPEVGVDVEAVRIVVVTVSATVTTCADEALALNADVPWYCATTECEPIASDVAVKLAAPSESVSVASVTVPSTNATEPVGVPPAELTVALNVIDTPGAADVAEAVKVVVVCRAAGELTVTVMAFDVLLASFVSPPYCAVTVWLPSPSAVVEKLAVPFASVPLPIDVVPSRKVTVPVAAAGETVAVNVTDWPDVTEDAESVRVVVVDTAPTVMVWAVDVLAASFVSPPYFAVTLSEPTGSFAVVRVAVPFERVPVPSEVVPL
jgi:hypothetical protein